MLESRNLPANNFSLEFTPAVTKFEDEPLYSDAYVRVITEPNYSANLTFSVEGLPPGIVYDSETGYFVGARSVPALHEIPAR